MKVLILNDKLAKGGKERRIVELVKYCLKNFNIQFQIILMKPGVDYPELLELGVDCLFLDSDNQSKMSLIVSLNKMIHEFQPDLIHSWSSMTDVIAVLLKPWHRKNIISSMIAQVIPQITYKDEDYLRSKFYFPFIKFITSNTIAGLKSYRAPLVKSFCIYNGFNFDRLKRIDSNTATRALKIDSDSIVVGMVAAFEVRKDQKTFILAAKSILKENIYPARFILIGSGETLVEMKLLAGEFEGKGIYFTGKIENVEDYVNRFDIGVLCTNSTVHGEGISNAILEYMAQGKPVIATNGGGTGEIVKDQINGFLIEPYDVIVLVEKLKNLFEHIQLRKQMGEKGLETVKRDFSMDSMGNKFYSLYKNCI